MGYDTELLSRITDLNTDNAHFIIDENVAAIYANEMSDIVKDKNTILIEATEQNKSIERVVGVISQLVKNQIRKMTC